jgi:hypothetical protein
MGSYTLLAMWMLAHQTLEQRHTLLAWHDERGTGDALRAELLSRHKQWAKHKTMSARRAAYASVIRDARSSKELSLRKQAHAMDAASMERLAT